MMSNPAIESAFESHVMNKQQNRIQIEITYPIGKICSMSIEYIIDNGILHHSIKESIGSANISFLQLYLEDLKTNPKEKLVIFKKDCWIKPSDNCFRCRLDESACSECYRRETEIVMNLESVLDFCIKNNIPWRRDE